MGLNLFDGSESSSSSDAEEISKIEIDQEFARRYEHNKRREDLHRLKELQKRGFVDGSDLNSDESSESDGYDDLDSNGKDLEFYDALVKVKKMDPILDSKDSKLFDSENEDEGGIEEGKKKKDKKPMYLKDVVAKHLIEEGAEFEEKDSGSKVKSYSEEQEEIRRSFLKAADEAFNGDDDDDDDDGGDLLVEKKKAEEEAGSDGEIDKRLDEYFGDDGNLSENEMFLKSFLKNKMWVDREAGQKPTDEEIMEVLEDAEELEKQEKFELECQFRHEEGTGDRVLGHARFVEGSVRKKSNTRKEQRKRKEERQTLAELERKEELKHLKNVKKKEIMEKLDKIRAIAGIGEDGGCALDVGDLEEDFNPEEYDKKMKEMFSEGYYDAEDPDPGFGSDCDLDDLKKPDFDKEDELLGLPKGWDVCRPGDGFLAVREKILKHKGDENDDEMSDGLEQDKEEGRQDGKKKRKRDGFVAVREKILRHREDGNGDEISADPEQEEEEEEEEEEKEEHRDGKRKRKHEISFQEKVALDKDLEEYYKLDYEDTIGDLKTRFKYTSVPSNRYGLNAAELLMADDKDLNQYVSLKKLAPYRQTEWKVSKLKRYDQKVKKKLLLQGGKANDLKVGKKGKSKHDSRAASSVPESSKQERTCLEESDGEAGDLSRRSKRRRRQAQLKLSQSRLKAYGKISPKPKSQKKH